MNTHQHDDELLDIAAGWIVKLRSPAACERDHVEFSQWLNQSKANEQAFDEMLATWDTLALGAELPASSWDPSAQTMGFWGRCKHLLSQYLPGPANSGYWLTGAVSFAAVLMVSVALLLDRQAPIEAEVYQTAAGESLFVELADHSVIELNTRTKIEVLYSPQERLVRLVEGEAYFDVQGNKARPFVVDVGRGTVTAIGTAFNIKRGGLQDWVAVTEGVVRVKQKKEPTTPFPASKFVQADQHLMLSGTGLGPATELGREIHWLEQTLSFENSALADALTELNRYLAKPVSFNPADLAGLRISGTFSTNAPQDTLQAILTTFDLHLSNQTVLPADQTAALPSKG
ncbi:FecR family protein [Halioxenophilus aromaticivorans]|uniref:FecR family protein n=1 Tax=Halioxenophilus aromaticivorans TaxID=1306992 RepID=A0AAV3U0R3_9ALTE